jgi:hypothetical protein
MISGECPRRYITITVRDLNAKIGRQDVCRTIIGEYSLHIESNYNFASLQNMVIGGTMFKHKDIHKMTLKSPNGNAFNQIDHLMIHARYLSNLIHIRSYRGVNTDSDHYLLISKIRSRISNVREKKWRPGQKI